MTFVRPYASELSRRLKAPRRHIHVVAGPRQVGKTTLVEHVTSKAKRPVSFISADVPALRDREWLTREWQTARDLANASKPSGAILVIDEVQKVADWSEVAKLLWDEDTRRRTPLRVVLLGSAPLLIEKGLNESLAGRFETLRLPHWSYIEMHEAFGWSVDRYIYYGGYPGAAPLTKEPERWRRYVLDSLIETTMARDVLLLTRVDKPALMRRLFELSCRYSGQELSFTKMLGQLHDAGNTTTLAHYLDLLAAAGMVTGLQKFSGDVARARGSSPKLQVFNTALMNAQSEYSFEEARANPDVWGRIVESAVGAHLANEAVVQRATLNYWRDGTREVDFVYRVGRKYSAIEVKSGRADAAVPGLSAFAGKYKPVRTLVVGSGGVPLEDFLTSPASRWLDAQAR